MVGYFKNKSRLVAIAKVAKLPSGDEPCDLKAYTMCFSILKKKTCGKNVPQGCDSRE